MDDPGEKVGKDGKENVDINKNFDVNADRNSNQNYTDYSTGSNKTETERKNEIVNDEDDNNIVTVSRISKENYTQENNKNSNFAQESRVEKESKEDITTKNEPEVMDDKKIDELLSRTVRRRRVSVHDAPEFTERLGSFKDSNAGETVTLVCRFKAWPRPTITWFRDDTQLKETARHSFDTNSDGDESIAKLMIKDVDSRDEGCYKCRVENDEGFASTTGYLSVSGKPAQSSSDRSRSPSPSSRLGSSPGRRTDRSLTPSGLRPIVEQKSMEEREAEECRRLGPSPIQEFIDVVRHKRRGLTKRARPLVFCPAEFYGDDNNSFDDEDSDVNGNETATDSDATVSPTHTPTLTSSPELSTIWGTSPFSTPNLIQKSSFHQQQPEQISMTKSNTTLAELKSNDQGRLNDVAIKSSSSSDISDSPLKLGISSPDSQYQSLVEIPGGNQSKEERDTSQRSSGSHYVNALPIWQTTSQVVYPISAPHTQFMRMVDDSDYDSDTTPISTPEVEISDPRLHLHLYSVNDRPNTETNLATKRSSRDYSHGLQVKQGADIIKTSCNNNTISNLVSVEKIQKAPGEHSERNMSLDEVSYERVDPTKRIGRSLQERRSRMFSDTMRRAASETRAEDFSRATVTSPFKPLSVSITTAARKPSLPSSGDTSGVDLSAGKPSFPSPTQAPQASFRSDTKPSHSEVPNLESKEQTKNNSESDFTGKQSLEKSFERTKPVGTIRATSRAITKSVDKNRRSRSVDVIIRTSSRTPINIKNDEKKIITDIDRATLDSNFTVLGKSAELHAKDPPQEIKSTEEPQERASAIPEAQTSSDAFLTAPIEPIQFTPIVSIVNDEISRQPSQICNKAFTQSASTAFTSEVQRSKTTDRREEPIQAVKSCIPENTSNTASLIIKTELFPKDSTAALNQSSPIDKLHVETTKSVNSTNIALGNIASISQIQQPSTNVNDTTENSFKGNIISASPIITANESARSIRSPSPCTNVTILSRQSVPVKHSINPREVKPSSPAHGKAVISISTAAAGSNKTSASRPTSANNSANTIDFSGVKPISFSVEDVSLNQSSTQILPVRENILLAQYSSNPNLNQNTVTVSSSNPPSLKELARINFPNAGRLVKSIDTKENEEHVIDQSSKPVVHETVTESHLLKYEIVENSRSIFTPLEQTGTNGYETTKEKAVPQNIEQRSIKVANKETFNQLFSLVHQTPQEQDQQKIFNDQAIQTPSTKKSNSLRVGVKLKSDSEVTTMLQEKLELKVQDTHYIRDMVDKVFESLSQASVQFYLLFISVATALAAASAAGVGGTVLTTYGPAIFVASGAIAVFMSEAFRFAPQNIFGQFLTAERQKSS